MRQKGAWPGAENFVGARTPAREWPTGRHREGGWRARPPFPHSMDGGLGLVAGSPSRSGLQDLCSSGDGVADAWHGACWLPLERPPRLTRPSLCQRFDEPHNWGTTFFIRSLCGLFEQVQRLW